MMRVKWIHLGVFEMPLTHIHLCMNLDHVLLQKIQNEY